MAVETDQEPDFPAEFEDGTIVVWTPDGEVPRLGKVSPTWSGSHWSYWLSYIDSPMTGRLGGGASGSWMAKRFRLPATAHEQLLAMAYRKQSRVLALEDELREAKALADAVRKTLTSFIEEGEA